MGHCRLSFDCRIFSAGLLAGVILGFTVNVLVVLSNGGVWIEMGPFCPWCRTRDLQDRRADTQPPRNLRYTIAGLGDDVLSNDNAVTITTNVSDTMDTVQVVCMVMLEGHKNTTSLFVKTVRMTWGQHCPYLVFYQHRIIGETSPEYLISDSSIKTLELDNAGDLNANRMKFRVAALYHSLSEFTNVDWFIMASMSTFVVVENLKYFLHDKYSIQEPRVFCDLREDFLTLDGGIVLNRISASIIACLEPDGVCCKNKSNTFSDLVNECFIKDSGIVTQPRDGDGRYIFNARETSYYFGYREKQTAEIDIDTSAVRKNLPSVFAVSFCDQKIQFLLETYFLLYHQETRGIYDQYRTNGETDHSTQKKTHL